MRRQSVLALGAIVCVMASAIPTTLASESTSTVILGTHDAMPITYRVEPALTPGLELSKLIESAFATWEEALHRYAALDPNAGHMRAFDIAPAPPGVVADIEVLLGPLAGPYGLAYPGTSPTHPGKILQVVIYMPLLHAGTCPNLPDVCMGIPGTHLPGGGPQNGLWSLSEDDYHLIATHEIGHGLGLPDGSGIMEQFWDHQRGPAEVQPRCFDHLSLEAITRAYEWIPGAWSPPPFQVSAAPPFTICVETISGESSSPLVGLVPR